MQAVRIRARGGSPDELAAIAQRAQAFTNASGTAIALSEGNAEEIICRASAGSSAPEVGTALRVEGTFTGLCIQSGKELRCDDAETDPRVDKAAIRALGIRSMVAVPIKEEDRVVGVLAVFAPNAHAFKITDVVVLKTMADQIAAYLHIRAAGGLPAEGKGKRRGETHPPEPLPAPPVKTVAASAAASAAPARAVVFKHAESAPTHRQHPVAPKAEPVRAATSAEEIDPAPFSRERRTNSHHEQKKSKTNFRPVFGTLSAAAAAAPEDRLRAKVLMIGAAAVVVIAVAVGLAFKLPRPAAAPQPALERSISLGTPAGPASGSANVQPGANNTAPAPPAKHDEAQPRREEARPEREVTVVLPAGPSRIHGARDNSPSASETPAISLGTVPASGSLLSLASPASQPPRPRLLARSELEPVTVIKKVPPVYPQVAKGSRLSGSVVVQGTVDKNGRIGDLELISGPPVFREAAFEAVKQWVFKPARLSGQPIEQTTRIRLDFGVK